MATTWNVGSDQACKTIKEALSFANDGDTIIVNAGDYTEEGTITINKSITIQAANAATIAADADKAIIDNIVINGGSDGNLLTVEIDGLQINAKTKNDMDWSQGVYLGTPYTESVTVKNCNIDLTNGQPGSSGIKMSLTPHGDNTETIVIENNIITGSAENTNSLIHIGDKENLKSLSVKDNTLSGCSSHGMNFDFEAATAYSIEIANNKVSVCGRDGIKLGGLKNADSTVTITENEVANVNNDRCDADDAAIALRGSGELQKVTVTGNEVSNAQVGVYFDPDVVKDTADDQAADITVSDNNIAIVEKHAPGVGETPAASGVSGFEPAADANTVVECEKLTDIIVDDDFTAKDGEVVTVNGKNYIMGTNAFANLTDAVNAASATEATTITVATGTYADNLYFRTKNLSGYDDTESGVGEFTPVEQKADITIKAADGADVKITGQWVLGERGANSFYVDGWNAALTVEGVTFDSTGLDEAGNTRGNLYTPNIKELNVNRCTFTGSGWGLNSKGSSPSVLNFDGCTIKNSFGPTGTISFNDCDFVDYTDDKGNVVGSASINIQTSNDVAFTDCDFDVTITESEFYLIRNANGAGPITLEGGSISVDIAKNIDDLVTDAIKCGAILVQRASNSEEKAWRIDNVDVTISEAALSAGLLLRKTNGSSALFVSSSDSDIADLLAKTSGTVKAVETNAKGDVVYTTTYADGVKGETIVAEGCIVVDSSIVENKDGSFTIGETTYAKGDEITHTDGVKYKLGENLFGSVNSAINASANDGSIVILAGEYSENVYLPNGGTKNLSFTGIGDVFFTGGVSIGYAFGPSKNGDSGKENGFLKNRYDGVLSFKNIDFQATAGSKVIDPTSEDYDKNNCNKTVRFSCINGGLSFVGCNFYAVDAEGKRGSFVESAFLVEGLVANSGVQNVTFDGCNFDDAQMKFARGNATCGFTGCTFTDSPINSWSGNGWYFDACNFKMDITEFAALNAAGENIYMVNYTTSSYTMTDPFRNGCNFAISNSGNTQLGEVADGQLRSAIIIQSRKDGETNAATGVSLSGTNFSGATSQMGAVANTLYASNGQPYTGDTCATDFEGVKADGKLADLDFVLNNSVGSAVYEEDNTAYEIVNGKVTSMTNLDKVLYLNGESYTADLEFKAIKAASKTSKITDADVKVGGLQVGTFEKDENISGSATLELSGVDVSITNDAQGENSSVWIGDYLNGDIDDFTNERAGNYTLILSNGSTIRSEKAYEGNVGGVAIRCDGILQITSGSSFYAQDVPIRGKVTVTDEGSIFRVLRGNMYGKDASITVLNDGTFEFAHTCGSCDSNTHSAGNTFIVGDNEGENAGKIIAGTDTEKGGIVKIGVADTLKVNALGVVEVKNGGQILGAEAEEMLNGTTYYSNLEINNGSVLVDGGTVDVGKITNQGTFKVTGKDASTVKAAITGKALQLENGTLADSNITGHVQVSGNSKITGKNFFNEAKDGTCNTIKVSGGTLTIDADAEISSNATNSGAISYRPLNYTNSVGLVAGNDNDWVSELGLANNGAGTINVAGYVAAGQVGAYADGTINVLAGGEVVADEMGASMADMTTGNAGVINIDGKVTAVRLFASYGGTINVNKGGEVALQVVNGSRRRISINENSTMNVKGGAVNLNIVDNNASSDVYLQVDGTVDVSEGGSITLARLEDPVYNAWNTVAQNHYIGIGANGLLSVNGSTVVASEIKNDGIFKVTGKEASTVKATITGKALQLENGVLENSEINGVVMAYGKNNISGTTTINSLRLGYNADKADNTNVNITGAYNGNFIVGWEDGNADSTYVLNIGEKEGKRTTVGKETESGNILNVHGANGSANIVNTDFYLHQLRAKGDVSFADSNIYLKKVDQAIFATVTLSNSIWDAENNFNSYVAVGSDSYNGNAKADAALIVNSKSKVFAYNLGLNNAGDYTINLSADKSSIEVENNLYIGSGATATLTGSDVVTNTVTVNGAITMDAASSITAKSLTEDSTGTITIDAKGFSGIKKVIDITGDNQAAWTEGQLVFKNLGETQVAYGADGDVVLANVDTKTLYVNRAWADSDPETAGNQPYAVGDAIPETDGKLAYGFNAFASINDAIKAAEKNGGAKIDLTTSKFSGSEAGLANASLFQTNGTYTFTGGDYIDFAYVDTPRSTEENAGKVSVNIVFDKAKVTAGKFRLDNGSSLEIKDSYIDAQSVHDSSTGWTTFYGDSTITVENSVIGWYTTKQTMESDEIVAGDQKTNYLETNGLYVGRMCYCGSGVMTVTNSTVFTYPNEGDAFSLAVYDKGLMSFTNSAVYAYSLAVGGAGSETVGRDNEVATMSFKNSTLRTTTTNGTNTERIVVGGANEAELIFDNSTVEKSAAAMTVESNGTVNVIDSKFTSGKVEIKTVAATETEPAKSGEFNVIGKNTLTIDNVTGTITAANGATLVGSTIGGEGVETTGYSYTLSVNGDKAGTVYFENGKDAEGNAVANTIASIDARKGDKVVVKNATLNFDTDLKQEGYNGDGFKVGKGSTWEIENSEINSYWLSLDNENGTEDVTTNMTVKNSTVNLTSTLSAKGAGKIGNGTSNVTFTDSTLNMDGKIQLQKQESAAINLKFDNTAVNMNGTGNAGSLVNYAKDGKITFTGEKTVAEFKGQFANSGTINIENNSKITGEYTGAWIEGDDNSSGNAGTINVTNASLTLKQSQNGTEAFANSGTITATNATIDIDSLKNSGDFTVTGDTTINIGKLTIENKKYLVFKDATLLNDSVITGGIVISDGKFTIAEKSSLKVNTINLYGNAVVEKDAVFTASITMVGGHLTIADGGALNVKYFNVDGVADVAGLVTVTNDSSKNYSTLVRNGVVNVSSTGSIVVNGCNGEVKAGGVLNINGGLVKVGITDPKSSGGKFKNSGTTNLNKGSIETDVAIENIGTFTATDASITAGTVTNSGTFTVKGTSSLNIDSVSGNAIELTGTLDKSKVGGFIEVVGNGVIKDSTVGGVAVGTDSSFAEYPYYKDGYSNKSNSLELAGENVTTGFIYGGSDGTPTTQNIILTAKQVNAAGAYLFDGANLIAKNDANVTFTHDVYVYDKFTATDKADVLVDKSNEFVIAGAGLVKVEKNASLTVNQGKIKVGFTVGNGNDSSNAADWKGESKGDLQVTSGGKFSVTGGVFGVSSLGSISVTNATLDSSVEIFNRGTITVSGVSTLNAAIDGEGAVIVKNGATLKGDLSANITVEGTVRLDKDADFTGEVSGKTLSITTDYAGSLKVTGGDGAIQVANGVKFQKDDDQFGKVTINGGNAVINAEDGVFAGTTINAKLAITGVDLEKGMIEANIALDKIVSVNGCAVSKASDGTFIFTDEGATYSLVKGENGVTFAKLSADKPIENVDALTKNSSPVRNYDVTTSRDMSAVNLQTADLNTTVRVANGKAASKNASEQRVEFKVGNIAKDPQAGGVNNINVGNYADMDVTFSVERAGNINIGRNSTLSIGEDLKGTSANQRISIGADSKMTLGEVDEVEYKVVKAAELNLYGGNNSISIANSSRTRNSNGSWEYADRAELIVAGAVKNINSMTVGNGGYVDIYGDYIAPEVNNSITLGEDAEMYTNGFDIITNCGDNIERNANGDITTVVPGSVGTNIRLGKGADLSTYDYAANDDDTYDDTYGDIIGLAGLTAGNEAYLDTKDIYGTDRNNTISIGNKAYLYAGNINLFSGNDTIRVGNDATFSLDIVDDSEYGNITGVENINVGSRAEFNVNDITGVNRLTSANGTAAKFDRQGNKLAEAEWTIVTIKGNVTGTEKNDFISFGSWNKAEAKSIKLGNGNDTLNIGSDSEFEVGYYDQNNNWVGDVTGVETINVGSRSYFGAGNVTGVNRLVAANGKEGDETAVYTADAVTGTEKNDFISFGNWNHTGIYGGINLDNGNDTVAIGNNSDAYISGINLDNGNDTLRIGNDSVLGVVSVDDNGVDTANVTGVETINVGARSGLVAADITGVNRLNAANGTAAKFDRQGNEIEEAKLTSVFATGKVTGTEKNDNLSFGNWNQVGVIGNVELSDGNDTLRIGNNSVAQFGNLDFGENSNGKVDNDILNIGSNVDLTVTDISNVETVNAGKGSTITDINGSVDNKGFNFDGLKGTWKNAELVVKEGLSYGEVESGLLYGNEYAEFDMTFDKQTSLTLEDFGANTKIELLAGDELKMTWVMKDTPVSFDLNAGDYTFRVSVIGADFDKSSAEDNQYSFKATLA